MGACHSPSACVTQTSVCFSPALATAGAAEAAAAGCAAVATAGAAAGAVAAPVAAVGAPPLDAVGAPLLDAVADGAVGALLVQATATSELIVAEAPRMPAWYRNLRRLTPSGWLSIVSISSVEWSRATVRTIFVRFSPGLARRVAPLIPPCRHVHLPRTGAA